MHNFGKEKVDYQVTSFSNAIIKYDCDVVALQEIYNSSEANLNIKKIISNLKGYNFIVQKGKSIQLLGFIYKSFLKVKYHNINLNLPKLFKTEQQLESKRSPFRLYLEDLDINIINVHLKSRAGIDNSGYKHELFRLRENIALRNYYAKKTYLIGDFNCDPDSVSIQSLFYDKEIDEFNFREDGVILELPVSLVDLYYEKTLKFNDKYGYSDYFVTKFKNYNLYSYVIESDHKMLIGEFDQFRNFK